MRYRIRGQQQPTEENKKDGSKRTVLLTLCFTASAPIFLGRDSHELLEATIEATVGGIPAFCGDGEYVFVGIPQQIARVVHLDIPHILRKGDPHALAEHSGQIGLVVS